MTHQPTITETPTGYAAVCPHCGPVASANDLWLAQVLGRLHARAFALAATAGVTP